MGNILTVPKDQIRKSTAGVSYAVAKNGDEHMIMRLAYHVTSPGKFTTKWWTMRDKLTHDEAQAIIDTGLDELDRLFPIPHH